MNTVNAHCPRTKARHAATRDLMAKRSNCNVQPRPRRLREASARSASSPHGVTARGPRTCVRQPHPPLASPVCEAASDPRSFVTSATMERSSMGTPSVGASGMLRSTIAPSSEGASGMVSSTIVPSLEGVSGHGASPLAPSPPSASTPASLADGAQRPTFVPTAAQTKPLGHALPVVPGSRHPARQTWVTVSHTRPESRAPQSASELHPQIPPGRQAAPSPAAVH